MWFLAYEITMRLRITRRERVAGRRVGWVWFLAYEILRYDYGLRGEGGRRGGWGWFLALRGYDTITDYEERAERGVVGGGCWVTVYDFVITSYSAYSP